MPIQQWSENVTVVRLSDDPAFTDDLQSLEAQYDANPTDVVLDFSAVRYINSSNISKLIGLRKKMVAQQQRLILCCIDTKVWGTFLVTGLDKVFQHSDDVTTALATIQLA
jgi:anti-anti-sigma factor